MMMIMMMMIIGDGGDNDDDPPALLFHFTTHFQHNYPKKTDTATPHREVRSRPIIIKRIMSSIRHSATFLRFAVVRTTRSKGPIECWFAFTKNAIEETQNSRRRVFAPAKRLILNGPLSDKMSNKPFFHTLANWGRSLYQRCHN